jgi:hypothetical protein
MKLALAHLFQKRFSLDGRRLASNDDSERPGPILELEVVREPTDGGLVDASFAVGYAIASIEQAEWGGSQKRRIQSESTS